jgi:hypothetical protein
MFKNVAVRILSLTLFAATANSQMRKDPSGPPQAQPVPAVTMEIGLSTDTQQHFQREQIAHVIAQRQNQLRLDTEKLVALTAELKQHVDEAGVNILSMDVIKKAQEIQKLAKSVQDKMKNAY